MFHSRVSFEPVMDVPRKAQTGAPTGDSASAAARRNGSNLIGGHPTEEQHAG
jgi:hypothetical protein